MLHPFASVVGLQYFLVIRQKERNREDLATILKECLESRYIMTRERSKRSNFQLEIGSFIYFSGVEQYR